MTFIVYLVVMLGVTPAPTFMILDDFSSMKDCQARIVDYVKKSELTKEQAAKLSCMALITSTLTDPL